MWLKHNNDDWDNIVKNWAKVFSLRQNDIKNGKDILKKWPLYKHSSGHVLIEIDFKLLYPEKENLLLRKWDNFRSKIIPIFNETIKDPTSLQLLKDLSGDINEDSRDYIVFLLLHNILKPSIVTITKEANKRVRWKPTILDSQQSTVLFLKAFNEYFSKIEELRETHKIRGLSLQPILIVVGDNIKCLTAFYTFYDGTLYKCSTFIKSLDLIFKIFQVLNFKYPIEGKNVYTFIQRFFYNISTDQDELNPNISNLITTLSKSIE